MSGGAGFDYEDYERERAQLDLDREAYAQVVRAREIRYQRVLLLACLLVLITAFGGLLWLVA